jgi:hypothetical protein
MTAAQKRENSLFNLIDMKKSSSYKIFRQYHLTAMCGVALANDKNRNLLFA